MKPIAIRGWRYDVPRAAVPLNAQEHDHPPGCWRHKRLSGERDRHTAPLYCRPQDTTVAVDGTEHAIEQVNRLLASSWGW
jgi:hypothetical protein